jgi:hypothetical protein
MAARREIKCVGPSAPLPDRKASVQRSINLFLRQITGLGEDKPVILESIPGLVERIDFGAQVRGSFSNGKREFVVAGLTLYETTSGTAVSRGTINGSDWVTMEDGTGQLFIAAGANGYVLNMTSNVLAEVTDPDWRGSYDVAELNGVFIFIALDQPDQFYISAIDDGSTLDALDFSSADAQPDDIVTVRVLKQEAYFFGDLSTEVWTFVGDSDFPLVRYNSTPIDIGIVGRRAAIKAADTLIFVGKTERGTGIVYMINGHQPQRISNEAVEAALQASGVDLSECSMWARQGVGYEHVGINAPGMPTTWVFDAATREWHEQAELVDGEYTALRVDQVSQLGTAQHAIAGEKQYTVDASTYTLGGDVLVRERTWPHLISPSMEPVVYTGLELACTTGHGGNVTLEISNDGGFNFGPPLLRSLGAIGRWMQRVRWFPLGSARDRVFRLRCTDAVPFNIHGATVE